MAEARERRTPKDLRSRLWFDNPDNPGMTALYLERYLNYGLTREELQGGKPIIGIAQTGSDLSPCNRHHIELAAPRPRGHHVGRRRRLRVPGPPDPGDRQAADGVARPQPRLSRPRRGALRLPPRRRRSAHRLRQDHPRLPDGRGDREPAGDRAERRPDAERLAPGRPHRLRHRGLEGARTSRGRRHRLRPVHGHRRLGGALRRALQHHGHRLDHERARRGARDDAARHGRDSRALPRARPGGLPDRAAHRRDGVGGPEAVRHHDPGGVRERHRGELGHRRLDQCADPHQRDRQAHRRAARQRRLGAGRPRDPAPRQHAAGGHLSRGGVPPGRRPARGHRGADRGREDPRGRAHGERPHDGRELPGPRCPGIGT